MEVSVLLAIMMALTTIPAVGALFFKRAAAKFNFNPIRQIKNHDLMIAIILIGAPTLIYVWALSLIPLSILYPVSSLTYVWVALLSVKFLREKMNLHKWMGIGSVIIGVVLITMNVN